MGTLVDFLKTRPDLAVKTTSVETAKPTEAITATAILLAADESKVLIAHLGKRFVVNRDDIIDVAESSAAIPNPFGRGVVVEITFKNDAQLTREEMVRARDLTTALPFAISRPSLVQGISRPINTPRETAWRAANLLPRGNAVAAEADTTCGTQTSTNSSSQSPVSS